MYPSECNEENHLFFNDTATTEIYTLSLHDALPICTAGHRATPLASSSVYHDGEQAQPGQQDRKSTRLNSSHLVISYAVFCLKKKIGSASKAISAPTETT